MLVQQNAIEFVCTPDAETQPNHWRYLFGEQPIDSPWDLHYNAAITVADPLIFKVLDSLDLSDDTIERAAALAYDAIHVAVALTLENAGISNEWQDLVTRMRGGRAPRMGKWESTIHENCPPESPHYLYLNEVNAAVEHECGDGIDALNLPEIIFERVNQMVFDVAHEACCSVLETAGVSDEWPDLLALIKRGVKVQR